MNRKIRRSPYMQRRDNALQSSVQASLMSSTRVLLADDHSFVRRGLRTILEATNHYEVCGEAADGSQTLELAAQLAPDILILDISMPPPNGLEVERGSASYFPTPGSCSSRCMTQRKCYVRQRRPARPAIS